MDILIEEYEGSLWVAAIEQRRMEGLDVDPIHERVRWGSIYWAKVERIDAALDAAFLNLDGDNSGVLFNRDVRFRDKKGNLMKGGNQPIGKVLKAGQYIMVQAKQGYLEPLDEEPVYLEDKAPQVSMDVAIQGRYMIFTPLDDSNRISSRIRDKKLRKQLEDMIKGLHDVHGCILRASAENTQSDVLIREGKILKAVWEGLSEYATGEEASLLMLGPDALQRALSDNSGRPIRTIEVVTMDHFQAAEEWCELFAPDLVPKIKPIELKDATRDLALLDHYDLFSQIEGLFQPYAILPGGGNLIIQGTSAFTAIDVNRGADKNSNVNINLQAGAEIARQIRLRNLGGNIIVDMITPKDEKEKKQIIEAMENAVNNDPCTVQVHGFTNLGMLELTRQRRTPPLFERIGYMFEKDQ